MCMCAMCYAVVGNASALSITLGTHGHMKCVFDKPLKAQDTVLMCLYKRLFPRWSYTPDIGFPPCGWRLDDSGREEEESEMLL